MNATAKVKGLNAYLFGALVSVGVLLWLNTAEAHSGGLAKDGCHNDTKVGAIALEHALGPGHVVAGRHCHPDGNRKVAITEAHAVTRAQLVDAQRALAEGQEELAATFLTLSECTGTVQDQDAAAQRHHNACTEIKVSTRRKAERASWWDETSVLAHGRSKARACGCDVDW